MITYLRQYMFIVILCVCAIQQQSILAFGVPTSEEPTSDSYEATLAAGAAVGIGLGLADSDSGTIYSGQPADVDKSFYDESVYETDPLTPEEAKKEGAITDDSQEHKARIDCDSCAKHHDCPYGKECPTACDHCDYY